MTNLPTFVTEHIDESMFNEMKALLDSDFEPLVCEYIQNSVHYLQLLTNAIEQQEYKICLNISHILKGSSLNLGLNRLGQLCGLLETSIRHNDQDCTSHLLTMISDEISASNTEIKKRLHIC